MDSPENKLNDGKFPQKHNIKKEDKDIHDISLLQNKKLDELKKQLLNNQKKIHDIELRKLADIENFKKNTEKKIKKIKNIKIENFLKQIIPVIDSLEDILTLSNELKIKKKPLIHGIELTLQSLFNILFKVGVTFEGKENELFNPVIHTPILIETSEITVPHYIVSIKKKGLTFNQILLRKAIVTITKK